MSRYHRNGGLALQCLKAQCGALGIVDQALPQVMWGAFPEHIRLRPSALAIDPRSRILRTGPCYQLSRVVVPREGNLTPSIFEEDLHAE